MDNAHTTADKSSENCATDAHARAVELYRQGRYAWQHGDRAAAISAYERSAALDPEGPGATALEMTRDIMDFYDTNQFNP
mgnify:FL=1